MHTLARIICHFSAILHVPNGSFFIPSTTSSSIQGCNLRSFGSKRTVLKKVLVTLLGLFGARVILVPLSRPCLDLQFKDKNSNEKSFVKQTDL